MIQYKNLDIDVDESREFLLISRTLQESNSEVRENAFASTITKSLVCDALDYVWGIARKRGNILDVYGTDLVVRCYRWELDHIADGMASAIAAAFNWFRWDGDGELVLVNWLCRNSLDQSEAEKRRVAAEERIKQSSLERSERRRRKKKETQKTVRTPEESVRTLSDFAEYEVSGHCPDNTCNNNNNNNNNIQKHVSCPDDSTPRPISGSEALEETRRILRDIPLCEPPLAVCSPHAFRDLITFYFDHDTHGNAVGLTNLPSGAQKYLERLYIDLSPYPPDVIRTAIESELKRPINPDIPNDGMILQTMSRIISDSMKIVGSSERSEKERKRMEKIQSEAERERIVEEERKRDAADFEALCELLAEGTDEDIESAIDERYPIANAIGGQRKMVETNRRIFRKKIRKRIQEIQKEMVKT